MTNKWLKLSELPNDFWQECFVAWKYNSTDDMGTFDHIVSVRKVGDKMEWFSEILEEWFDFRGEHEYRVLPIVYPAITKEDFE